MRTKPEHSAGFTTMVEGYALVARRRLGLSRWVVAVASLGLLLSWVGAEAAPPKGKRPRLHVLFSHYQGHFPLRYVLPNGKTCGFVGGPDNGGQTEQVEKYAAGIADKRPTHENSKRLDRLGFDPNEVRVSIAAQKRTDCGVSDYNESAHLWNAHPNIVVFRTDLSGKGRFIPKELFYFKGAQQRARAHLTQVVNEENIGVISGGYAGDAALANMHAMRATGVPYVHKIHAAAIRKEQDVADAIAQEGLEKGLAKVASLHLPHRLWWEQEVFGHPDVVTLSNAQAELDILCGTGHYKRLEHGLAGRAGVVKINPSPFDERFDRQRQITTEDYALHQKFLGALEKGGISAQRLQTKVPLVSLGRADRSKFHLALLDLFERQPHLAEVVNGAILLSNANDPRDPFIQDLKRRHEALLAREPRLRGALALSFEDVNVDKRFASAVYRIQRAKGKHLLSVAGGVKESYGMMFLEAAASGAVPVVSEQSGYRKDAAEAAVFPVGRDGQPKPLDLAMIIWALATDKKHREATAEVSFRNIKHTVGNAPAQDHLAHLLLAIENAREISPKGSPIGPRRRDVLPLEHCLDLLFPGWEGAATQP